MADHHEGGALLLGQVLQDNLQAVGELLAPHTALGITGVVAGDLTGAGRLFVQRVDALLVLRLADLVEADIDRIPDLLLERATPSRRNF